MKKVALLYGLAQSQNDFMFHFSMSTSSVVGPEQKALSSVHPVRKLEEETFKHVEDPLPYGLEKT